MIALIVLIGDDSREAYESRLLDTIEVVDMDRLRRKEVRMDEKEMDWKREFRMLGVMFVLRSLMARREGERVGEEGDKF